MRPAKSSGGSLDSLLNILRCAPEQVIFQANRVSVDGHELGFAELVKLAYLARISLSATGFYKTPKIH